MLGAREKKHDARPYFESFFCVTYSRSRDRKNRVVVVVALDNLIPFFESYSVSRTAVYIYAVPQAEREKYRRPPPPRHGPSKQLLLQVSYNSFYSHVVSKGVSILSQRTRK